MATRVLVGPGSLAGLLPYRDQPVLLVTDEHLLKSQIFAEVSGMFIGQKAVFSRVRADPDVAGIAAGVVSYLDSSPAVVVALGGGSVMDAAKAMHRAAAECGRAAPLGIVAIPTTSGSGSEVTSFSVVTDVSAGVKVPLVDPVLIPELAILDPMAAAGAPAAVTADAGMDAITHAIEAYVSLGANDLTDACAEKATRLGLEFLARSWRDGDDLEARSGMQSAACLAAIAFDNAGLGVTHGLAHSIGGQFKVAHGRLNAILLPHVIEFNSADQRAADRYACLARLCGISGFGRAGALNLAGALRRLATQIAIPANLSLAGVDPDQFSARITHLADAALADGCNATNPVKVTGPDLVTLLRAALQ